MKLIRRKQEPHATQKAANAARLAAKGLMMQRVARKGARRAAKGYKWTRRLPYLLGGAVVVGGAAKLMGRKKEAPAPQKSYPPPAPAPEPPRKPEAPTSPEVAASVNDGAPPTEPELDVEAPNESTPPAPSEADKES
jgi:hypothetical protein